LEGGVRLSARWLADLVAAAMLPGAAGCLQLPARAREQPVWIAAL